MNKQEPILVDARGNPLVFGTGSEGYRGLSDSKSRQPVPRMARDRMDMLNRWSHIKMISESRYVVGRHSPLRGGLNQKSHYVNAAGWRPQYKGKNKEWGKRAEKRLKQYFKRCNVRGGNFTFDTCKRLECRALDEDGDWFKIWVKHPVTGLPMSQNIEGHRVGNLPGQKVVQGNEHKNAAKFAGAKIVNGIMFGDYGEQLGIQIITNPYLPEVLDVIGKGSYQHGCNPEFFSESRSVPPVAYAIFDWSDQAEIRSNQMQKNKVGSKLIMTADTSTGRLFQPITNAANPVPTASMKGGPIEMQEINEGEVWTFQAGKGEGVKPFILDTPGKGYILFDELIERACFYAVGWRREMLDLKGLVSAGIHAFADMINHSIFHRWDLQRGYAIEETQWYVAGLIDTGELSEDEDWDMWDFIPPAEFSANPSRSQSGDLDALRAGVTTRPKLIAKRGGDYEENLEEEADYIVVRDRIAKERGIDPKELGRTDQPGDAVASVPDGEVEDDTKDES